MFFSHTGKTGKEGRKEEKKKAQSKFHFHKERIVKEKKSKRRRR